MPDWTPKREEEALVWARWLRSRSTDDTSHRYIDDGIREIKRLRADAEAVDAAEAARHRELNAALEAAAQENHRLQRDLDAALATRQ